MEIPSVHPVPGQVRISLVSHTNAGKTTLARTLLRRDVGEVLDQAHVTEEAEHHVLVESPEGERLILWDTPGFGDTARLYRRLKQSDSALIAFLNDLWDRFTDRPFWCSQMALRTVREETDLVLYLVNAAESPFEAAYVPVEMRILEWTRKPVIVLLNQTGPPRNPEAVEQDREAWQSHLQGYDCVREVLELDAFTRCWVQEGLLLQTLGRWLDPSIQPVHQRLVDQWRHEQVALFRKSMDTLGEVLQQAAQDREPMPLVPLVQRVSRLIAYRENAEMQQAMKNLGERLVRRAGSALDELIRLHGLDGQALREISSHFHTDYQVSQRASTGVLATLGGFLSGAVSGLSADLLAGGLTFGGGALVGGLLGAAGGAALAESYNLVRGRKTTTLAWSPSFLEDFTQQLVLRYLAVAHFGRGRGAYQETATPQFWEEETATALAERSSQLHACIAQWQEADGPEARPQIVPPGRLLAGITARVLAQRFPEAASWSLEGESTSGHT